VCVEGRADHKARVSPIARAYRRGASPRGAGRGRSRARAHNRRGQRLARTELPDGADGPGTEDAHRTLTERRRRGAQVGTSLRGPSGVASNSHQWWLGSCRLSLRGLCRVKEVHDDFDNIWRAGSNRSGVQRSRSGRARRVPGRLPGLDPRRVRLGSPPVRDVVSRPRPASVRRSSHGHRILRSRSGCQRSCPVDGRAAAMHDRGLLPVRRRRRPH